MAYEYRRPEGGRIDRSRKLNFHFNGKPYSGYAGDTLASALLANGVSLTARSFKYHRPRGIVGSGVEEPATLVELEGEDASGNNPVTLVPLRDGLRAKSVNCWPSPGFDIGSVNQMIARFIPAGFYYKTFKWPDWHLFEPAIRRAAGLAPAPSVPPASGRFEARNAHADVLIAGAGPAGLMAALVAGRAGARVFLADEGSEPGGGLLARNLRIDGAPALEWVTRVTAELAEMENVTHLQNATVWAYREHNLLMVNERSPATSGVIERSWRVRAAQVICATGAIERSMVFANNDRPGVMMASAIQTYVNRYATLPGTRAVLFTNNNSAYSVAADMRAGGITIAAIIDSRSTVPPQALAMVGGIRVLTGHVITSCKGHRRVRGVSVAALDGSNVQNIACDLVGLSGGWNPALHLFSQSRGSLKYDPGIASFIPDVPAQPTHSVGAASGRMSLAEALQTGAEVARMASQSLGLDPDPGEVPDAEDLPYAIEPLWRVQTRKTRGKGLPRHSERCLGR